MDDEIDLATRVKQFNLMELPGQPRIMHMGTSYLVNDLYNTIRKLNKEIDALNGILPSEQDNLK